MATIEELKHKIATASDLQSVVKTMKALAAVSIRQYEKAVESLSEYDRTLELGLQILLKNRPEVLLRKTAISHSRIGIVVLVLIGECAVNLMNELPAIPMKN